MQGIKREQLHTRPLKKRLPVTTSIMRQIKEVLLGHPHQYHNILMWAVCCTAFFGFLHCSEFTIPTQHSYDPEVPLSIDDLAVDSIVTPSLIKITIRQSKTDPFQEGVDLYLGRTDMEICPVQAMSPYLGVHGSKAGPLFITSDGRPLTRQLFSSSLSTILKKAELDVTNYNTHSFRIGAATSAKDAGISDSEVQMLGRWKSGAFQQYIHTSRDRLVKFSKELAALR